MSDALKKFLNPNHNSNLPEPEIVQKPVQDREPTPEEIEAAEAALQTDDPAILAHNQQILAAVEKVGLKPPSEKCASCRGLAECVMLQLFGGMGR